MRGKDFNTGLRGVLFEAQHYERMGAAIWLYGWLVLRQTHQSGSVGWVLGGSAITYGEIEEETGFNPRTLERWMQALRRGGYVETETRPGGIIVRILRAKKFPQVARKSADGVRKVAGQRTHGCGDTYTQVSGNKSLERRIRSSLLDRSTTKTDTQLFHRDLHSPLETAASDQKGPVEKSDSSRAQTNFGTALRSDPQTPNDHPRQNHPLDLRLLRQLLRNERDEAVRRELAVGSGPEVRRP